jgi:hypothetical protein
MADFGKISLLRAIATALAIMLATPIGAHAEADYTEEKLQAFVSGAIAAQAMAGRWMRVIEETESEDLVKIYRVQANEDMRAAVDGVEGLTYQEYVEIIEVLRENPELAARVETMYNDRVPQ